MPPCGPHFPVSVVKLSPDDAVAVVVRAAAFIRSRNLLLGEPMNASDVTSLVLEAYVPLCAGTRAISATERNRKDLW